MSANLLSQGHKKGKFNDLCLQAGAAICYFHGMPKKASPRDTVIIADDKIVKKNDTATVYADITVTQDIDSSLFDLPTVNEKRFFGESVRSGETEKYSLKEKLVSGGMGSIFRVIDQDLHRTSAMKVILPDLKKNIRVFRDFISEAKITGMLEHPNIVPVHDLGVSDEAGLYFTMKLVKGELLIDILDGIEKGDPKYKKYNNFCLLEIFRKVSDAVSFAHSKDIIHRDIKPQNIIVGEFGEVLLMDWGLAKFIGKKRGHKDLAESGILGDLEESKNERDGMIKGSPSYFSPEQASGTVGTIDKRSDIFLLGSTLYHMFTLEPPYTGGDVMEAVAKAENRDMTPPGKRAPGRQIPGEICRIIMKAMARDKRDRYQTVEEMSEEIDQVIAGKWLEDEKKIFKPGDIIMKEGEPGKTAYLILKGKVKITKKSGRKEVALATLGPGDIVGEMALITGERRSATATALGETEATLLTGDVVRRNLEKLPPYMEKIIVSLTNRLREASKRIADSK